MNDYVIRDHQLRCNDCNENLAPDHNLNQLGFLFHMVAGHELEAGEPSTFFERMNAVIDGTIISSDVRS